MNRFYCYFFEYKFLKAGLLSRGDDLILIDIVRDRENFKEYALKAHSPCCEDAEPFYSVTRELTDYLNGERTSFSTPYLLAGSPFQLKVWRQTACIPYGSVKTYRDIAEETGHPKAVRAVGSAVGKNSIPIIIPCHRVIKTGGYVGEFGGGRDLKIQLLTHEGIKIRDNRIETEPV
jgi:methylated-DNA-[protein]-cysteine S-methyltransferase